MISCLGCWRPSSALKRHAIDRLGQLLRPSTPCSSTVRPAHVDISLWCACLPACLLTARRRPTCPMDASRDSTSSYGHAGPSLPLQKGVSSTTTMDKMAPEHKSGESHQAVETKPAMPVVRKLLRTIASSSRASVPIVSAQFDALYVRLPAAERILPVLLVANCACSF